MNPLLLLVGVILLVVGWQLFGAEQKDRTGGTLGPGKSLEEDSGSGVRTPSDLSAVPVDSDPDSADDRDAAEPPAPAAGSDTASKERFAGKGSIRGRVLVQGEAVFPRKYTVAIAPSRTLAGRNQAVRRETEFSDGEHEFVLEDVPLGGYDVSVRAPGMNSRRTPVLLVQGSANPFVDVVIYPRGFIDGVVLDEEGSEVEDLLVTLENTETREMLETRTLASGAFLFEKVADGNYRITFGAPESPLVEARELSFQAPAMHFPTVEVPVMGELLIRSVDPDGAPVPECEIEGFGANGGTFSGTTDHLAYLEVKNLKPGEWSLRTKSAAGTINKMTAVVEASKRKEIFVAVTE